MGAEHSHDQSTSNFTWIPSSVNDSVPHNAVPAGNDIRGEPIFVGRTIHKGDQLPVKVIPTNRSAFLSYGGDEIGVNRYEVLTGSGFHWVASSNGQIPPNAVSSGKQRNGERLYIGRAHIQGSMCPGKVHPTHGCLYVPFAGAEHRIHHYEVLVRASHTAPPFDHNANTIRWVRTSRGGNPPHDAFIAGQDVDNSNLYCGRALHEGRHLPAKVGQRGAWVSWAGREIEKSDYEILCGNRYNWVSVGQNLMLPHGAVSTGPGVYIGRVLHHGRWTPGKIDTANQTMYIPYGGQEVEYRHGCQVLVQFTF